MKLKVLSIFMLVILLTVGGLFAAPDNDIEDVKVFKLCVPVDVMGLDSGKFESAAVLIKLDDKLFSYEYFEGIDVAHDQLLSLFSGQPEVADRFMDIFFAGKQQIDVTLIFNGNQVKTMTFEALQNNYAGLTLDNYIGAKLKMSYLFKGAQKVLGKSLYNLITGYYSPEVNSWLSRIAGNSRCEPLPALAEQLMPWQKPQTGPEGISRIMYSSCNDVSNPGTCLTFHTRSTTYSSWSYYTTVTSDFPLIGRPFPISLTECYRYYYKKYRRTKTTKDIYENTCDGSYCEYPGTVTYEYYLSFDKKVTVACP